jgi:hypothetical protein
LKHSKLRPLPGNLSLNRIHRKAKTVANYNSSESEQLDEGDCDLETSDSFAEVSLEERKTQSGGVHVCLDVVSKFDGGESMEEIAERGQSIDVADEKQEPDCAGDGGGGEDSLDISLSTTEIILCALKNNQPLENQDDSVWSELFSMSSFQICFMAERLIVR